MSLKRINLNLLPLLNELLTRRHVSRAAEALGLGQPSASKALKELRAVFKDQLLVRIGTVYELTPLAESMKAEVEDLCTQLQGLMQPLTFDAHTSQREFVMAATDYGPTLFLPGFVRAVTSEALSVSMRFVNMPKDLATLGREVDLALSVNDENVPGFETLPLFYDEQVAIEHIDKRFRARLTFMDIARHSSDLPQGPLPPDLLADEPVVGSVPLLAMLPILVALSGATSVAPRSVVNALSPHLPVRIRDGAPVGPRVTVALAWHRRLTNDPGHKWLRNMIESIVDGWGVERPPRPDA